MSQVTKKFKDYIRPNITYTDSLSKKEIMEYLQDFEKVTDIDNVPIGSFVSYIDTADNKVLFRLGGSIMVNKPEFLVLSSGRLTFSVQKENKIFFKRLNCSDIKKEMENYISEYRYIINQKNQTIKELAFQIKELKSKKN